MSGPAVHEALAEQIAAWDGDSVVSRFDRLTGTWIFIALHNASLGRPTGGTRMRSYPTPAEALADAQRLASGMTRKWAVLDTAGFGGGKAVLAVARPLEGAEREGLLRRYGQLVEGLRGAFATGADLGTSPADLVVIAEETAWVHGVDREKKVAVDSGPYTATGVLAAIQASLAHHYGTDSLEGRTVLVEGVGAVGRPLARELSAAGARLKVADIDPARAAAVAAEVGGTAIAAAEVIGEPCDLYAPCAIGGILNEETIPRLRCTIVAGAANNQLRDERSDAQRLIDRDILYSPDFINNSGAAIGLTRRAEGLAEAEVDREIRSIGATVREVLAESKRRGESPLVAADRRVQARLSADASD